MEYNLLFLLLILGNVRLTFNEYKALCEGITEGNVGAVKDFLSERPDAVDAWINPYETPLLKACACGNPEVVKALLLHMTPEQMLPKLSSDMPFYHTPLTVVAASGNMEIAEALIEKNPNLLVTPGIRESIPVVVAVEKMQKEMVSYLYNRTPVQVFVDRDGYHGSELFVKAIYYKWINIALDLFGKCKDLAFTQHPKVKWNPITLMASNPDFYIGGCHFLGTFKRFIYSCPYYSETILHYNDPSCSCTLISHSYKSFLPYLMLGIRVELPMLQERSHIKRGHNKLSGKLLKCLLKWTGIDDVYKWKMRHLQVKELLRRISEETLTMELTERSMALDDALWCAVRYGNVEFLVEMVTNNSELLWSSYKGSGVFLFFFAIQYRQKEVLNFLYGLKQRHLMLTEVNWKGHGFLHLASYIAPHERLVTIAGAVLQMQSELKWFLEIKRIAPPVLEKDGSNLLVDEPSELFRKEHEELRKEAEKSMKDMAGSCSVVAALILTVTFAAIFTVPGGTDDNSRGRPFHLKDQRFVIFIVSDIISCFTSCTSVLIFLGILTSRYNFYDFLVSLPTKMIARLSLLFISITAMLTAFWSALFTTLNQKSWIIAPVILVASFPAILFVKLQYPLLKDMIVSTYGKGVLNRNISPTDNRSAGFRARTFILKVLSSTRNKLFSCGKN
ncbi:unnamed protein product [Eruca vesicaria subsp. sativa]|uniref:PGG domain-containing protein n=1 Tax=Eruca vesicaria subsp. sativa TaxID=29727 RepID=A0ABC8K8C7_ERUVS|nr:unnamed protein product [Eruca vesicaria subsp. sativa]